QPSQAGGFSTGFSINQFLSTRGAINLHGSTIMENDNILVDRIPEPNAPQAPASVVATVKVNDKGAFRPVKDIKTHSYKVVVHSDDAESLASEAVTAVVANPTDSVSLAVKLQSLYQAKPQFISVYRQGNETGHYFLVARVPLSKADENGVITFVDRNQVIPETTDVFIGELTPQVISLLELLPMMKLPLAQMNATTTFTVLWY
ncbi:capsid protein, partial [Bacillus thuringiensis]|nr:capsid protein [Bacillus thuringiensis]